MNVFGSWRIHTPDMSMISGWTCITVLVLAMMLTSASPVVRAYRSSRSFRNAVVPRGRIDAYVIPQNLEAMPTPSIYGRTQRSHKPSRRLRVECENEHYTVKAFRARIVLHVRAQSVETIKTPSSYSVHFKIIKSLKQSSWPIHEMISLSFSNSTGRCDKSRNGRRRKLLGADIRASQEYIIFLNATSNDDFKIVGAPEPLKRRRHREDMLSVLQKVCSPKFRPKPVSISKLEDKSSWNMKKQIKRRKQRLKLVCRSTGLPFPRITWRKNNVTLTNNTHMQITYVKRRSTLKIRNASEQDSGRYECIAWDLNHSYKSRSIDVQVKIRVTTTTSSPLSEIDDKKQCPIEYATKYCLNGGTCFEDLDPLERYCMCPSGYEGDRCQYKDSYVS
ncbi:protein vein-like isoform X1 [Cylas formicarius]|uniref:protein vein-like isoform X1 n=1 Tax=Cylas formicarius TaxID=197179 RepID=UPI00295870A7|nr:protein vein-like isoform X1 [Cylas formicarius]